MQSKLATWSTENKERKFDRLLRLIADRDWLSEAARITLASSAARTPGVDGVDKRVLEANLQHELATIREELLAGSYSPLPARRVYIPKANCVFRTKLDSDFASSWTYISREGGHGFTASWTAISREAGQ